MSEALVGAFGVSHQVTYRLVAASVPLQVFNTSGTNLSVKALAVQHLHGVKGQQSYTHSNRVHIQE